MKTTLDFEQTNTKKLLAKLDFEFFLKQNIEIEKYKQEDIDKIYSSYTKTLNLINIKAKVNRRQFNYYSEGQVRKMFTGGLLPAHFELDESRQSVIIDFIAMGEDWAYFKYWQMYYKRKITKEKVWEVLIKAGSVLAFLLSIIKLFEFFNQHDI